MKKKKMLVDAYARLAKPIAFYDSIMKRAAIECSMKERQFEILWAKYQELLSRYRAQGIEVFFCNTPQLEGQRRCDMSKTIYQISGVRVSKRKFERHQEEKKQKERAEKREADQKRAWEEIDKYKNEYIEKFLNAPKDLIYREIGELLFVSSSEYAELRERTFGYRIDMANIDSFRQRIEFLLELLNKIT